MWERSSKRLVPFVTRVMGSGKDKMASVVSTPVILLGALSVMFLGGCASTSNSSTEQFMGEGFHVTLPQSRDRVVVWGNHSGSVTRALSWLHDKDLIVVDPSWVEKGFKDPGFARRNRSQQKTQVLEVAKEVDASVVVFTQVEENRVARKFDVMSWSNKTLKIVNVEIRGMNAETGEVMFGAKVWNSEPTTVSEEFVLDLTSRGLERAWNHSQPEVARVQQGMGDAQETRNPEPQETPAPHINPASPQESTSSSPETVMTPDPQDEGSMPSSGKAIYAQSQESLDQETPHSTNEMASENTGESLSGEEGQEETDSDSSSDSSVGLKMASGGVTLIYAPFKIAYAIVGGIMGGFAYVLTGGNTNVSQPIWDSSLKGDYWVSPDHLKGEQPLRFQGGSSP